MYTVLKTEFSKDKGDKEWFIESCETAYYETLRMKPIEVINFNLDIYEHKYPDSFLYENKSSDVHIIRYKDNDTDIKIVYQIIKIISD